MITEEPGSFRDPGGQVYVGDTRVIRTVNASAAQDFAAARESGLHRDLIGREWLIDYEFVPPDDINTGGAPPAYVLEHPRLPLVSYPYEWTFSALQAAALLHLDVHLAALERNFTLSDATAYNVQFLGTKPLFIDLLSFVRYHDGDLWVGHRQFCEQFLNPLLLDAYLGVSHQQWFRGALEGIAVDDLNALLPWWRRMAPQTFMHVYMQSALQRRAGSAELPRKQASDRGRRLPKAGLIQMLRGLRRWIGRLTRHSSGATVWEHYAQQTSYDADETARKKVRVSTFIAGVGAKQVWDIGCNTGEYLRAAIGAGANYGVGLDFDLGALEVGFARAKQDGVQLQFLYMDAANPSPDHGWAQRERGGLLSRARGDAVLALALVHHLAISKNVPLPRLLDWIVALAPAGVVEFVPKQDPMVQVLLQNRKDVFPDYTEDIFRSLLAARASITHVETVSASGRSLFCFERPH